jgi:hypothetical protein
VDSDLVAGNIKSGVNILGVNGSVVELKGETKTITPTTSQQTINPSSGKNGITQITVNPVTSIIDANISAQNIKSGVSILGVWGSLTPGITPSGNINITNMNQTDVTNYATAQVVDANIVAGNIKKNVVILGVTGDYEGSGGGGGLQGHTLSVITYNDGYDHTSGIRVYKTDGSYEDFLNASANTYVVQDAVYFEPLNTGDYYGGMYITYPDIGTRRFINGGLGYANNIRFYVLMDGISAQASYDNGCFLKGTKITLSDGSEKNAEDITYDDELLV